jgi:hypothetical protein
VIIDESKPEKELNIAQTANYAEKSTIRTSVMDIGSHYEEIERMICEVFGEECEMAKKVAFCESSYNPRAINWNDAKHTGFPSQGIFQINAPYNEELFNPKINIAVAKEMHGRRGWKPWINCAKKLNLL